MIAKFKTSLLIFAAVFTITFRNIKDNISVIPGLPVNISPFTATMSANDNPNEFLTLKFTCSLEFSSYLFFVSKLINICNGLDFRGRVSDLNYYLSKLDVELHDYPSTPQSISYVLQNANGKQILSVSQNFTFIKEITFKSVNDVYEYNPDQTGQAEKMATVDISYFKNVITPEFEVILESVPTWLETFFEGDSLYFKITRQSRSIEMSGFRYYVVEKRSNLRSKDNNFRVTTKNGIFPQKETKHQETSRFKFFLMILFMVGIGTIFYVFICRVHQQEEKKEEIIVSINAQKLAQQDNLQSTSFEIKGDVLSNSVITWNQNLMARQGRNLKGTEENELVSHEDIQVQNSISELRFPGGVVNKDFDDISEIGGENKHPGAMHHGNNSLFLEGLNL